jgi:Zn-dependent protease with chaperone function
MSLELGLAAASAMLFLAAAASASLLSTAAFPFVIARLCRLDPAMRAYFLLGWSALPGLAGALVVCLTLAPSVTHGLGFGLDHCHAHDHHAHLCLVHTALFSGSTPERLLLGTIGASLLAWATVVGTRLRRQRQVLEMLLALGSASNVGIRHCIVPSRRAFALTAGWFDPAILISSRLLDDLVPAEVSTVLAHEQAHQHRRDGLRLVAAEIISRLHWPATRSRILGQLSLAIEQACDEAAARYSGDRLGVAATIVKLSRLGAVEGQTAFATSPAFTGADTADRVQALLQPALTARPGVAIGALLIGALLTIAGVATSDWWHHSAESLLSLHLG